METQPELDSDALSVLEWARERLRNTERIASLKSDMDRLSWLEDRAYWQEIVRRLEIYERAMERVRRYKGAH